ncbi:MAG: CRTAC1 family protein [Planctomycetales bacterium]|nr:CRTAC1 family protein [Planctomycetales bacterium]
MVGKRNEDPRTVVQQRATGDDESAADEEDDARIGYALRVSLIVMAVMLGIGGAVAWGLLRKEPPEYDEPVAVALPTVRDSAAVQLPAIPFVDVTAAAGIDFTHCNGAYGEKLLPETMGGGCAFFDYDNDGDQDLLLVNSCPWSWHGGPGDASTAAATPSVLYRNDGSGRFEDVTAQADLTEPIYGMGCAVGDFDGDGWDDLFITAVGENVLLRNDQGRFVDVTETAGVAGAPDAWSTSACWCDVDGDGDLDLFVCNYVRWSREIDLGQDFRLVGVGRAYGPPTAFEGSVPYLYLNEGDGSFSDVSASAGIEIRNADTGVPVAKSLAVRPIDLDEDGRMDLVVANDTVRNFVFHNLGQAQFEEVGAAAGLAFDSGGNARGAMGIDAADFRNSDTLGIAIGNFANEMTALYIAQDSPLQFSDGAISTGLGPPTRLSLTFGLFFFDADLDGRPDLFAANGHLEQDINQVQVSQHYEQAPQLFWNAGTGRSSELVLLPPENCGDDFSLPLVGRGATYADIDADGDLDVLITAVGARARLLRNDQQTGHHWLRVALVGPEANHRGIGARILVRSGEGAQKRDIMPTRSYLAQVEPVATFGLGDSETVDEVTVSWPDGTRQTVEVPGVDQLLTVSYAPAAGP